VGAPLYELIAAWGLLVLAGVIAVQAVATAWNQTNRPAPGFGVLENLLVGIGGLERGALLPFDFVRVMDGRVLTSGAEIQAAVRAHPPGTRFRYIVNRGSRLVEVDVPSVTRTMRDFERYLLEGLLTAALFLALGAVVLWLKPGVPETRLFLGFCLTWFAIAGLYLDAHTTYRWTTIFLAAVAVCPAVSIHLALTFPERRWIARRHPRVVAAPYLLSALLVPSMVGWVPPPSPDSLLLIPAVTTAYWGAALVILIASLARTSRVGATPLLRQRARVLMVAFAAGQLVPVLGTAAEAVLRVPVPYLNVLWRLNILFPLAVAYAMVRYDLFDLRAVIRTGAIYGVVTGLVALAYAGAITLLDVAFAALGVRAWPIVSPIVLALTVVLLLNPVYARAQKLVDRIFFRERRDVEQALERFSDDMTTLHDVDRIVALIHGMVDEFLRPERLVVLVLHAERGLYQVAAGEPAAGARTIGADGPLARCLAMVRGPLTRERIAEAPGLGRHRTDALAELESLGGALALPLVFRGRVTGVLVLGDKRSGAAYSTFDLRVLRFVANQSAVALENARAYTDLQRANTELRNALRRVEILETIRQSLAKFVPATVQRLIEEAPESPELDKRPVDVSVLFVDIAGYTRLTERLDPGRANQLVELYFGAFLDEILRHGGDVNETAGDGLMVLFRDDDPRRHARAAILTALAILERARQIGIETEGAFGPVALHIGVNSGVAAVGATKIEGQAGTRWTYTASGSVTNLAARLAALGAGDGVFIGPETRERIGSEFAVQDLGEYRLRNVEEPVRVFRLAPPGAP
jgi:class 3 adenylate cyclase